MHLSSSVHYLGFILDPVLSLSDHVNSVSRSCFYYIRQLRSIRQWRPLHAITILDHEFICARVDNGNATYIALSSTWICSQCCCLSHRDMPKFSHISSFIRNSLHWLPIRKQTQFKICYRMRNCTNCMRNCCTGSAPQYRKAYCRLVSSIPSRSTLQSSAWGQLFVPRTRTSMTQPKSVANYRGHIQLEQVISVP